MNDDRDAVSCSVVAASASTATVRKPVCWAHLTGDVCDFDTGHGPILSALSVRALPLARKGDIVILPAPGEIPQDLGYHQSFALGPDPFDVHWADLTGHEEGRVTEGLPITKGMCIDVMSGTSRDVRKIAEHYGARVVAPDLDVCRNANSKSWQQELVIKIGGVPIPLGGSVLNVEEARRVVDELRTAGYPVVRFKPKNSASGIGQVVIGGNFESYGDLMYPGVVQAQINVVSCHSVQFFVNARHLAELVHEGPKAQVFEVIDQIVDGNGGYEGSVYPSMLIDDEKNRLQTMAWRIVSRLAVEGFNGYGSVDFMRDTSGNFWFAEVNGRKTATYYAAMISRRIFGKVVPFVLRSFRFPKHMPFPAFGKHMGAWMLRPGSSEGFFPFAYLPRFGFSYGVTFSPDAEKVRRLDAQVRLNMAPLTRSA